MEKKQGFAHTVLSFKQKTPPYCCFTISISTPQILKTALLCHGDISKLMNAAYFLFATMRRVIKIFLDSFRYKKFWPSLNTVCQNSLSTVFILHPNPSTFRSQVPLWLGKTKPKTSKTIPFIIFSSAKLLQKHVQTLRLEEDSLCFVNTNPYSRCIEFSYVPYLDEWAGATILFIINRGIGPQAFVNLMV